MGLIAKTIQTKNHLPLPALLLGLAMLIYALSFSHLTLTRYAAFEARALDLGNLHQTVWNTANGRPFHMTNQPGTINRLSLHVEPILLPIAALYWLHDGAETLLILQSVVVALGAWPLYALAVYRLRNHWAALLLGIVWLLNPTIQAANWLEFHPVTLAPTFLMAAFYCLITRRNGWFVCFAVLAASCKEEIGLLLFMMGGYAALFLRRYKMGGWSMALALSWSLVAVLGIQQFVADGNIHWSRYDYLGESPFDKLLALFTRPDLVWQQLQQADAVGYLFRLLWPVGLIALFAPAVLLLALPSLAINLLADFPPMHQVYELIYAAPIIPFVMLATVEGVGRVTGSNTRHGTRISHHFLLAIITGCTLFAQYQYGYLPGGGHYRLYPVTEHDRQAATVIAQIPADAKVSAQDKLDPHVAGRETIYIFPRVDDADTIFVDVTGPAWPQHPTDLYASIQMLLAEDFGVAVGHDGYLLLRKDATSDVIPDPFYSAFRLPSSPNNMLTQRDPIVTFANQLTLFHYELLYDEHGETVVRLYWQLHDGLVTEDYRIYVGFADANGNVLHDTLFYPPVATLWYPTSAWLPDETILVQTLPWTLETEQVTLLLGLYRGEDGWTNGDRLPISTPATAERILLENNSVVRLGGYQQTTKGWEEIDLQQVAEELAKQPIGASFGTDASQFTLSSVTLESSPEQAGESLIFTLDWQAGEQAIDFDYALFAHLLNEQGEKVAQIDWQPRDQLGPRPMSGWLPHSSIRDQQQLVLPEMLPPGNYQLILGVYNWQTGKRLAIEGNGANPDQVVTITQLSIK